MKIIITICFLIFLFEHMVFGDIWAFISCLKYIPKSIYYGIHDLYFYIKNKEWTKFHGSGIWMYGGGFGTGKSLSIVEYCEQLNRSYKNIRFISNIDLHNIPYTDFRYFEQLNDEKPDYPGQHLIFVIDELGSLQNSRNYKDNQISQTEFLIKLNQIRHDDILLLVAAQQFKMLDKVYRQVGDIWFECHRSWRYIWRYIYDPYDLEYCGDPRLISPVKMIPETTFRNKFLSDAYDTKRNVRPFDNYIDVSGDNSLDTDMYKYAPKAKRKYWKR